MSIKEGKPGVMRHGFIPVFSQFSLIYQHLIHNFRHSSRLV